MKTPALSPVLALLAVLPLVSCKPSAKSLLREHDLIHESAFYEDDDCMEAEAKGLIRHYLRTGDARATSPEHKLTMLHLAASTHRLWLVEKLLAEGADPNARALMPLASPYEAGTSLQPGPTPAYLAVNIPFGRTNEDALIIIKALVAAGADLNIPASGGILSACQLKWTEKITGDALAAELIKLGARADECDVVNIAASLCWPKALKALLATPEGKTLAEKELANLLVCNAGDFNGEASELTCAALLLQHYPTLPAWPSDEHTPLFIIAKKNQTEKYASEDDEDRRKANADYMALMLKHGEDPLRADGEFRRSCAADYIAASPKMKELLKERGYDISAPAHHFSTEAALVEQLLDIPAEAISDAEVQAQYDTIATLFSAPTEAMFGTKLLYRQACAKALHLLLRADAPRTQALLMQHPAWRDAAAWQGDAHAARGLLFALKEEGKAVLPADFLLESARVMEEAGRADVAKSWCCLLAFDDSEDTAALIERLCDDSQPLPVRAAARCCKLYRAGLPSLGDVEKWLDEEHSCAVHNANMPIIHALRAEKSMRCINKLTPLTMPERLFYQPDGAPAAYGKPDEEEQADTIASLRALDAPLAARLCGDKEPLEPSAEVKALAERYGDAVAASIELEDAVARHILTHEQAFRSPWAPSPVEAESMEHSR